MANKVFLFVGFVLLATTVLLWYTLDSATIEINGQITTDTSTIAMVKNYLCGGLGLLGGFFFLIGLRGMMRESQQAKRNLYILQNGIETQGTVIFVDKNYSMLVNNKPIYSIVEYNYKDRVGKQYTRRINNINSDLVIRMNIQVGGTINVKYLGESPGESIMLTA